jgi:uncharacterized membrane protein SirB2
VNVYLIVLYVHLSCVVLSGTGFLLRGVLMLRGSPLLSLRLMRVVPHINDTLLLGAAIILCFLGKQYPFVQPWLTAKVIGLIAYILLGWLALKGTRGAHPGLRAATWLAALAVFGYIISVAVTKDPRGIFAELIAAAG